MIITMRDTETNEISNKIDELHEERGEVALGRVLTLLIVTDEDHLEHTLALANDASRDHPCRVIAIAPSSRRMTESEEDRTYLDAEVRIGADAGAGEIIVLRPRGGLIHHLDTLVTPLLVPDAPIVAWWPTEAPANPSKDLVGAMAQSRITDAMRSANPMRTVEDLRRNRSPKNVDMSWTRLTRWRALLAAMLDQPPHMRITAANVVGEADYLPKDLLAAWLAVSLDIPVSIETDAEATAICAVSLTREDGGVLSLVRCHDHDDIVTISVPGQSPQTIPLPMRSLGDCLSEELGRLYPDEIYAKVITDGWRRIHPDATQARQ
ncbi:glucose-6-phosphate dehydrogenase assembly protein OpcA [Bifidobacterium castoris]|uniref:OpcA protein n=1 Tax=Bifidobacterium castoris TaxID=2306972 RepID=A0A430F9V9_9BIFI|nr:glucose-6-phosphate dehydrogenase assembly protein OpcA [Bifidobacterium castoris]RSX49592.1 OpcA protein [Bifidobacterium castoris]